MTLHDFIRYLNTWLATQRFITQNNFNPTEKLFQNLLTVWGSPDSERIITWKLVLKSGKVVIIGFTALFIGNQPK